MVWPAKNGCATCLRTPPRSRWGAREQIVSTVLPTMLSFHPARLIAFVLAGTVLASCSGGVVGDYLPQWAGGAPKNLPPRPGTPEYDAFRQKQDAEAARDKRKDPPSSKAEPEKKSSSQ
jgi:hypothetical protein